jgi:hypothetical protein
MGKYMSTGSSGEDRIEKNVEYGGRGEEGKGQITYLGRGAFESAQHSTA